MTTTTDAELVQRVRAGDQEAFAILVERYTALVHGVLLDRVRRYHDVEDLVQEVFVRAYEGLGGLDDPKRFGAWLHRMACNTGIDWLRRRSARTQAEARLSLEPRSQLSWRHTPADELEADERATVLWQALDRLPAEYRRVVVLQYVEGCSQKAIARFLGISVPAVKWRLMRARSRLQVALIELYGPEISHAASDPHERHAKILGALPLVMSIRRPRPRWGDLLWRVGAGVGVAAIAGVGFLAAARAPAARMEAEATVDAPGYRVRLAEAGQFRAPPVSVLWSPARPRAGETVRVEVAGLEAEGNHAWLHYITDPEYPQDAVVPLRREGDAWVAHVTAPPDAAGLFLRTSATEAQPQDLSHLAYLTDDRRLREYEHSMVLYGTDDRPRPGARAAQARLALRQGKDAATIGELAAAEARRHPPGLEALQIAWRARLRARTAADSARVRFEQLALRRERPDDEDVLWALAAASPTAALRRDAYRALVDSLPHAEGHDRALHELAMWAGQETGLVRAASLRRLVREHPGSVYVDEAYTGLLDILREAAPEACLALADSLIDGQIVVAVDSLREAEQACSHKRAGGALPASYAYTTKADLLAARGNWPAARETIEALLASGIQDPRAYAYLAARLLGDGLDQAASYPDDPALAKRLLETGLASARVSTILALPGSRMPYGPEWVRQERHDLDLSQAEGLRLGILWSLARAELRLGDPGAALPLLNEARDLAASMRERGDAALLDRRTVSAVARQAAELYEARGEKEQAPHGWRCWRTSWRIERPRRR